MPGTSHTVVDVVTLLPDLLLEHGHSFLQLPGMLTVEHYLSGEMPSIEKDYFTGTLIPAPGMSLPLILLVLKIQRPNTFV